MPIQTVSGGVVDDDQTSKKQLLAKIEKEVLKPFVLDDDEFEEDFLAVDEAAERERVRSLESFRRMAELTKEVKLDKLIQVRLNLGDLIGVFKCTLSKIRY